MWGEIDVFVYYDGCFCVVAAGERTVVMDKSKGEPVISVKTKSKERVNNFFFFFLNKYFVVS